MDTIIVQISLKLSPFLFIAVGWIVLMSMKCSVQLEFLSDVAKLEN
jgi:hypothetical protein